MANNNKVRRQSLLLKERCEWTLTDVICIITADEASKETWSIATWEDTAADIQMDMNKEERCKRQELNI